MEVELLCMFSLSIIFSKTRGSKILGEFLIQVESNSFSFGDSVIFMEASYNVYI